jgi:Tol biopolymer transport system component
MKIGKILSIVLVSVAGIIVLGALAIAVTVFGFSRSEKEQNFSPPEGQQAVSPIGNIVLLSQSSGSSSFLYRRDSPSGKNVRLTSASAGIESEASFSHDGKLVVYSFAESPESKSSVWLVGIDGSNPHAITGKDEDALHPAFSPDDSKVFYAASKFTGHHSPIARPARHEWDVLSIPVQASGTNTGITPTQVTHKSFYDLRSLDVAADGVSPGGTKLLISTTGYPIGALIEEFILEDSGRDKIFQPHVFR